MEISMRAARVNAGYTQEQMAAMLGVGTSSVSRWEKGELDIPKSMFMRYCQVCKVNPSDLQNVRIRKGGRKP